MPVGTLLPLGFFRKSCFRNPLVRHLAIASVTMVVYMCAWNAQLGVYEDWNLFANVALPVSILAGFCTIKAVGRHSFIVLFPLMVMWALHTGTWIVGNHHQQYYIGRTLRARIEVVGVDGDKGSVNTYFGTIKSIDGKRGIILATQAGDIRLPGNVNALTKMPRQCLCRNAGSEEADFVVTWIKRSNQW